MKRKRRRADLVEQVSKVSKKPVRKKPAFKGQLVSTGSTLLDLACYDIYDQGGFATGRMVNLIGDSSSGKSLMAMTLLAEAAHDDRFKKYKLVYDDCEHAMAFNMDKLFGRRTRKRIEKPPRGYSETMESFAYNVGDLLEDGTPFIYILDSFDSVSDEAELKKAEEKRKGKDKAGSYGMTKAKASSELFRIITNKLAKTGSLLVVVSQTRDNINPMSFTPKTRSGGKALKFYATHEMWTAPAGKIKSKDVEIGVNVRVKVSKNKLTGKVRTVGFPIYYDYGIDDIASCIDFLVAEGRWKAKTKSSIDAVDFKLKGTQAKIISKIEKEGLLDELKDIVREIWAEKEADVISKISKRKPRYANE